MSQGTSHPRVLVGRAVTLWAPRFILPVWWAVRLFVTRTRIRAEPPRPTHESPRRLQTWAARTLSGRAPDRARARRVRSTCASGWHQAKIQSLGSTPDGAGHTR